MSGGLGEARTGPMKAAREGAAHVQGSGNAKALRWQRAECVRTRREVGVGHSSAVQCEENGALSRELWTDFGI